MLLTARIFASSFHFHCTAILKCHNYFNFLRTALVSSHFFLLNQFKVVGLKPNFSLVCMSLAHGRKLEYPCRDQESMQTPNRVVPTTQWIQTYELLTITSQQELPHHHAPPGLVSLTIIHPIMSPA